MADFLDICICNIIARYTVCVPDSHGILFGYIIKINLQLLKPLDLIISVMF